MISLPLWRDMPPTAVDTIAEVHDDVGAHAADVGRAVAARAAEAVGA